MWAPGGESWREGEVAGCVCVGQLWAMERQVGSLVVGIDVGGTNTDAALVFTPAPRLGKEGQQRLTERLEGWAAALAASGRQAEADELLVQVQRRRAQQQWQDASGEWRDASLRGVILGWVKRSTTEDVTAGVAEAVRAVVGDVWAASEIDAALVGTTHFVNAIVQRSDSLSPVAVLRLCGPATDALPPFVSLPPDLAAIVGGHAALAQGGLEIDGEKEITPVDPAEVAAFVEACLAKDIHCLVVSGVFSPVSAAQELHVRDLIEAELTARLGSEAAGGCKIVTLSRFVALFLSLIQNVSLFQTR